MTGEVTLEGYLSELRTDIESALDSVLGAIPAPPVIAQPMRYSLMGPGKRLRPCLTLAVADSVADLTGQPRDTARALARPGACAVEMIHTYSLVHDDLPAMDNDAMRRGRPTTHIVHGDGVAILAGDGLLTDAFWVLSTVPTPGQIAAGVEAPVERRLRAVAILAAAAGSPGMVGGQTIDLTAVGRGSGSVDALDDISLADMHARKTGALIRAACTIGAVLTGADDRVVTAVDRFAADLGLAFQIVDDILDVEGSAEDLGKTAGKDAASGKPTFPALYGLDRSRELAGECVGRARAALDAVGLDGRLGEIADWSLNRRR